MKGGLNVLCVPCGKPIPVAAAVALGIKLACSAGGSASNVHIFTGFFRPISSNLAGQHACAHLFFFQIRVCYSLGLCDITIYVSPHNLALPQYPVTFAQVVLYYLVWSVVWLITQIHRKSCLSSFNKMGHEPVHILIYDIIISRDVFHSPMLTDLLETPPPSPQLTLVITPLDVSAIAFSYS